WGDDDRLVGEIKVNLYSPQFTISTCTDGGATCGQEIQFSNWMLELTLGNILQPMYLGVNNAGNFELEVKNIRQAALDSKVGGVSAATLTSGLGWGAGANAGTRDAAPNKE